MRAALLLLFLAATASAQVRSVTDPDPIDPTTGRSIFCGPDTIGRNAQTCSAKFTRQCGQNDDCQPPATWASEASRGPFRASVRFGGAVKEGRDTWWLWVKTGNVAPCTAKERANGPWYAFACDAPVGAVLYRTMPPFTAKEAP